MVRKYTRKRNIKRKRKFKKSKRNKKRGGRRSKKRRKKYSRKRNIKRYFRGGVKTGYKEEKVENQKKFETKEQLPKEKYGNELWQKKKEEPKNDADEIKYKKKWGFKWKDRNKYTSLPEGPLFYGYESKIHLDPSIIRTGNMSQLEATKKKEKERLAVLQQQLVEKRKKQDREVRKKTEKGDIRHVLFEHCLQNLDNIPPHLIHPFQKYMVDLILTCDNATELKDLFWLLNYRIDKKTYGFDEGDGHKWHEMEKVFIPTDGVPYLEWNNKEDADNNIKLLKGVFDIIRKNCKLFWKTIWKDKEGSPIWTSEWRGLLERFKGIKSYLPKNKKAPLIKKEEKNPFQKKKAEGGTKSPMDAPTNYDDDIPEWWGAGNDGPPSYADDSESEDDESNEPSESKIHKIQYSPTGWEGENDEGFVWGGPSSDLVVIMNDDELWVPIWW